MKVHTIRKTYQKPTTTIHSFQTTAFIAASPPPPDSDFEIETPDGSSISSGTEDPGPSGRAKHMPYYSAWDTWE